jgi:hypothetical protein
MVMTYGNNNNIYSVDMMFAYINIFKLKSVSVKVVDYERVLNYPGWGDPLTKIKFSPIDVLQNPEKYEKDFARINNAKLSFPIIIGNGNIVDGVYRLAKAIQNNKKNIKAYIFDKNLIKKFLVDKNRNYKKINNMKEWEFIELFYRRFNN